jgi:glycosyltransferase involved in cell wall biosynthesis
MRIAVDATCWHNRRGYGRHARALLRALATLDRDNLYTLFLDSIEDAEPTPPECEVRVLQAAVPTFRAASATGHRTLADMGRMSRALSAREFDMVLFPTIYSYVPVFSSACKLIMVHDIIAETYPKLTTPGRRERLFWDIKVRLGYWQADALITVSEYSRAGILKRFRVNPRNLFVVGEAADPVFRRLDHPVPSPNLLRLGIDGSRRMVLYVGGFSPHKNLEVLITAFSRIAARKEFADLQLVMVGDTTGDAFLTCVGTLKAQIDALGLSERVIFTGYLDDEDVVVLMNMAEVLALPSLMEGFGLPAVEAAACGCPVVATRESPLEGLLGEAGIYVGPDEAGIEEAMVRVLSSEELRAHMRERGLAVARSLTWPAAARQMMDVIQRVASK